MANTLGPPPLGTGWDETCPLTTDAHGNGMYEVRDLRMGVRIRMNKEHTTTGASSAGGEHKQGSAVCWIQTTAPTTRPDGATALTVADIGRVWIDTTNNVMKALTAVGSPNTWTPIGEILLATYTAGSEPTRGLYMKGNELYFKGADAVEKLVGGLLDEDDMASDSATQVPSQQSVKAHVADATVTMTNKTLTGPVLTSPVSTGGTFASPALDSAVLNTALSGSAVLDEDDMASNSATAVATQQSVKAYVDNQMNPVSYAEEESITFGNGLILKQGNEAWQVAATITITFATAFPTAAVRGFLQVVYSLASSNAVVVISSLSASQLVIKTPGATATSINWFVIGY